MKEIIKSLIRALLNLRVGFFHVFPVPVCSIEPVTLAALITAGGAIAGGGLSFFGSSKGKGGGEAKNYEAYLDAISKKVPAFWHDPYIEKTQDYLFPLGKDLVAGNVPEWLSPLISQGSPEFENVLSLAKRDTEQSVQESAIRRGAGRGGSVMSAVSKAISDVSTQYRWQDFLRAMEGRKYVFGEGVNIVGDVRSAALQNQGMKNQYELSKFGMAMQGAGNMFQYDNLLGASESSLYRNLASGILGGAGSLAAMFGKGDKKDGLGQADTDKIGQIIQLANAASSAWA